MTIERVTLNDPEARSADPVADNIAALKALFPAAVADCRIDFDTLRQLLGDEVDDGDERYGLNWPSKRRARRLALTPSTGTLRPAREDSVDWDTTRNLMIEGDNLEVLKLLQKSYAGKVKLIYIDPPYNTGNDFVYPDNYSDSLSNYLERTGQDDGGFKTTSNPESSGRFHADWLSMIYPRLLVASSLLKREGAIFVSCNDKESSRLALVMDEIFGEENFIAQIVWQRSKKGDAKLIAGVHEYVLCYVRNKEAAISAGIWRKPKDGAQEVLAYYKSLRDALGSDHEAVRRGMMEWYRQLPDEDARKSHKHYSWSDDRGLYFPDNFAGPDDGRASRPRHDILHPVTGRSCKKPSTGWRWDEEKTKWALEQDPPRIHFGSDESTIPNRKSYLHEIDSEPFSSVFYKDGRAATLEVESLVGKGVFPFPKNTDVIQELVSLTTTSNDIVLDFFAGSGTTGHAIMNLNATAEDNRRFVLVQLPEATGRSDYTTISAITRKRLSAAGKRIRETMTKEADLGFRNYTLTSSNLRPWEPGEDLAADLLAAADNIVQGRTEDDLLTELLLKQGIDLTEPMVTETIAGAPVHAMGGGVLVVCLAPVTAAGAEALADGIADWIERLNPVSAATIFFKDAGFENDVAKANVAAILDQRLDDKLLKVRSL
jgi:adenine-specific DNA-methyltransferase